MIIRKVIAVIILVACVSTIAYIFWKQELRYSLPTPVPSNYAAIRPGEAVKLPAGLEHGQAYFLHFYNPDCPCSRFNARHIQSLIRSHDDSMRFVIVVPDASALAKAQSTFGSDLTYKTDTDHKIAAACGVYSTPQAAIVDSQGKLYYRGNYNSSRYCTTKATNFAELSLLALMKNQPAPILDILATQSYGCELSNANSDLEFF